MDLPATPLLDLIAELERLAKARIAEARTPTDEQRTADQLKLVLSVIDGPVHFAMKDE